MTALPQAPRIEAPDAAAPATHRAVRWLVYAAVMGMLLLRLPQTRAMLEARVPVEAPEELEPELLQLAVSVALVLGIIAFAIVLAIYLGLARLLEKHLFRGTLRLGRTMHIGLFTAIIVATLVPLQVWSFVSGAMPASAAKALPVVLLCLAVLVLYRQSLEQVGRRRAVLVGVVAIALGAAVSIV